MKFSLGLLLLSLGLVLSAQSFAPRDATAGPATGSLTVVMNGNTPHATVCGFNSGQSYSVVAVKQGENTVTDGIGFWPLEGCMSFDMNPLASGTYRLYVVKGYWFHGNINLNKPLSNVVTVTVP